MERSHRADNQARLLGLASGGRSAVAGRPAEATPPLAEEATGSLGVGLVGVRLHTSHPLTTLAAWYAREEARGLRLHAA